MIIRPIWTFVSVVGFAILSQPALVVGEEAAAPAAPAAPAETKAPETPMLRPIVIKFSGEIVSVTRDTPAQPVVVIRDRYGVSKEMTADASSAKVLRGTTAATLDELKPGDSVTVDYTYDVATGKRTVQTITIAEASAPAPATAP